MHCEPERWDGNEIRPMHATPLLTPEIVEAHLQQARLRRSQAFAASIRALFGSFRRGAERRPRTLYAQLATWGPG